jgi:iron complex outermembrane receptor protein
MQNKGLVPSDASIKATKAFLFGNTLTVFAVAVSTNTTPGSAQVSTTNMVNSTEIIVSASREHQLPENIPAHVTVLTADDIAASDAKNVVEALQEVEGVYFRSISGDPTQAEISMRGFGENSHGRVLVLLDGRKLNQPDMAGINWTMIPLDNIERIEILRGSQSVLYGDYAVGGVINIVTKKGSQKPAGTIKAQFGSYGYNEQRASLTGSKEALSYAAAVERSQSSGYRDRSAYLSGGGAASLNYDITPDHTLRLSANYNSLDQQLPGGLSYEQMKADPRQSLNPDDDSEKKVGLLDLGWNGKITGTLFSEASLFFGNKDTDTDMTSWDSFSEGTINSIGFTPRINFVTEPFAHKNKLLLGLDTYYDELTIDRYTSRAHSEKTGDATITKQTVGGYVRDEFDITEKWQISAGARIDQCHIDAEETSGNLDVLDKGITHNADALEAALLFKPCKDTKLFARASSVYRFPFVDEQASYIGYQTDALYQNVDPEYGYNYEAGLDTKLPYDIDAGVTVFRLDMHDEIAYNADTYRNENLDDTRHEGIESYAACQLFEKILLKSTYTFTKAEFVSGQFDGNDIPLVPQHKFTQLATLKLPFNFAFDTRLNYVDSQYLGSDNANSGRKLDDYVTVDMALKFTPDLTERIVLEAMIGVDNIFDENYASVGYKGFTKDSYYPAPDRTYKCAISARF